MRRLLLMLLALPLLLPARGALGQADLVDQLLARYTRPKAAAGDDALHLVYLARLEPEELSKSHYWRYRPAKGWEPQYTFRGHDEIAWFNGALYVFRADNYTVYTQDDWRPSHWPQPWPPATACRVDKELWVFGPRSVAGKHRLRVARFNQTAPGEPPEGPAVFGGRLDLPQRPYDVEAESDGERVWLFWHQRGEAEGVNEVWSAAFEGERWTEPERVPVPYASSDFTAAMHQGRLWLFAKERGRRISAQRPLKVMVKDADGWGETQAVPHTEDTRIDWTFGIEAASFEDRLFLVRACRHRVLVHQHSDGKWLAPEAIVSVPPWASYVLWWGLANAVVCLVLTPVVAWRAFQVRHQHKQAIFPSGHVLTVSSWSRRTAALLLDFFIVEFLWLGVSALFSLGEGQAAEQLTDLPPMVALHVVVFFAYFLFGESVRGQTIGKRLLGIAVILKDGRRPSGRAVFLRNLLRPWLPLMPAAYAVGSLVLFLTSARQRLGDLLAGTIVVEVPRQPQKVESEESS